MRLADHKTNVIGVHPVLFSYWFLADEVCRKILGYEMIITHCLDGKHMAKSLHYVGLAWDVRTWTTPTSGIQIDQYLRRLLAETLQEVLGDAFDVVEHDTHLHIELQPKNIIEAIEVFKLLS